ncbi:MAG: hypothetical protein ACLR3C_12925 [Eggerthella lenta]
MRLLAQAAYCEARGHEREYRFKRLRAVEERLVRRAAREPFEQV